MGNFFKSKVFKGSIVLTAFGFLGKALGAVFKIGLVSLVGSLGMGIYQLVFPLLVFFIVLSSDGFALALTINIAEDKTGARHRAYFRLALFLVLIVSLVSALTIIMFAEKICQLQGNRISPYLYYVVALGVVVISILSVVKAKIRGEERFKLYSVAEMVEDLFRVAFGLILGRLLLDRGVESAVAGVIFGVVLSSLITVVFLLFFRNKKKQVMVEPIPLSGLEKKKFLNFSLLALISALVVPAVQFVESAIIVNLLTDAGASVVQATKLYGLSRGSVSALINLPFFLLATLEVLLLPNLARSKNGGIYYKKTQISLYLSIFVSLPFVLLFFSFSPTIVQVVYGSALTQAELVVSANLLRLGSLGIIFSSISTILAIFLNSNNLVSGPLCATGIAGILKLAFLIIFVPKLSIYAVELSSVLFGMVGCLVNLIFALRAGVFKRPKRVFLMALAWGGLFGVTWLFYLLYLRFIASQVLATLAAFCSVGLVVVLGILVLILTRKNLITNMIKNWFGNE